MCAFRRAHSTHLLRVFTDLSNDNWWEVDLFAVKLVGTNWALLDELCAERLELLHKELGHVLDILDVSGMSISVVCVDRSYALKVARHAAEVSHKP